MFGNDDQNQNPGAQTMPGADATAPATDMVAPSPASVADMPAQNIGVEPDVVASAPSAPTIADPMVTPSAQPVAGINGVPMDNAYAQPAPQVGPAKSSDPASVLAATPAMATATDTAAVDPDLAQIKQQALQSLEPLVGQLDQAPEEKFKTVMMLVQASDNSKMLKEAYEAAGQITDEKTRAQALLDIVKEVNYFTQQNQQQ